MNPLTIPVVVLGANAIVNIYRLLVSGRADPVQIAGIALFAVVLPLYLRHAPAAGKVFVLGLAALCPLYFALSLTGFYPKPSSWLSWAVIAAIYTACLVVLWRLMSRYPAYLASVAAPSTPEIGGIGPRRQ